MADQPLPPATVTRTASRPRGRSLAVATLVVLSLPIALYGLAFPFSPGANPDFYARLMAMPWYAHAHFLGSGTALLVGGFQFSGRLRGARPGLHRWMGRTYLIGCLLGGLGGLGGLGLATISFGGMSTHVGFGLLAVLWLLTGSKAYLAIRRGDVADHRHWMIRSFALTFAAVTLRIELGLFTGLVGMSFDEAYLTVAWLCWVPNLVVAEWWLIHERS